MVDKITGKKTAVTPSPADKAAADLETKKIKDAKAAQEQAKKDEQAKRNAPTSVVKPPVTNPSTGLPAGTGFGKEDYEFTTDSLGNVFKTMPDGTSELYRATEVADEFMSDSLGNVYKTMPDGTYKLHKAAEVPKDVAETTPEEKDTTEDTVVAKNTESEYFQDDEGNYYVRGLGGSYELAFYADGSAANTEIYPEESDILFANNTDNIDNTDYSVADNSGISYNEYYKTGGDYSDVDYVKRGGLISMMKQGGVPKFASGNLVDEEGMITDYAKSDEDGSLYKPLGRNEYGDSYAPVLGNQGRYLERNTASMANSNDSGISYQEAFRLPDGAVDNGDGTYTIGRFTYDTMSDEYLYSMDDGQITNVNPNVIYSQSDPNNDYYSQDSLGNIFKNGEFYRAADVPEKITNIGSGPRATATNNPPPALNNPPLGDAKNPFSGITDFLGTTAGAAGAGALLASILGSDMGGGTGAQNQGLDMSKVGVINPRTTDFGIGPTRFAGFEDYGTSGGDYTPNAELLKDLNAPGYNPVNEGDYGYDEVPAETPKMSSGGLSSMATPVSSYYTFGQPADILANLGMRPPPPMNPIEEAPQIGQQQPPQQAQQQGLPQQMPTQMPQQTPQGMPQQGMMPQQQGMPPPMRKGGLPHISNVPMTQGRMDFRRGSAVHGEGDGQSDDIPAMLADGEYVIDSETVAQIGNGSTKAGAQALDKFREGIRAHKRSAPINKIPPKTKALTSYLKGAR